MIKKGVLLLLVIFCFGLYHCEKTDPNAVALSVEFSWEGLVPCVAGGNPEIRVRGIPVATKTLVVSLRDHGMSHGKRILAYDGSGIIQKGVLDKIEGPCPAFDPGQYTFGVKALNDKGVVIGVGSKERQFPEE